MYHIICPAKYRRKVFTEAVEDTLKSICLGISERYEINFIEVGADKDHVHFLIQSIPSISVINIVKTIKSITAKEIFSKHKEVKQFLWGGHLWTSGFYANTVDQYCNEKILKEYVQKQGKEYKLLYRGQLKLFEDL